MHRSPDGVRRAYERYRTTHIVDRWSSRHALETVDQIRAHLPSERDELIVELGCGSGELLELLHAAGYERLLGVDWSVEQLAEAERRGVAVRQGDARDIVRNLDEQAAAFLAIDFLEHLEVDAILELLDAAAKKLRNAGTFIARVPNPQSPFGGAFMFGDITHRSVLAPSALLQLLRLAGFDSVVIEPAAPSPFGFRSRVRRLLWGIQQRVFRFAFQIETGAGTEPVLSLNYIAIARRSLPTPD